MSKDDKNDAYRRWLKEVYEPARKKFPERRDRFVTPSGLEVSPTYGNGRDEGDAEREYPGEYPYTRGIHPTMYRGRPWTMRQYAGFSNAADSNKRFRYLLDHGTTGLSIAFDLPTQIGYDSDHSMSTGEVGKVGVAIDSLADM